MISENPAETFRVTVVIYTETKTKSTLPGKRASFEWKRYNHKRVIVTSRLIYPALLRSVSAMSFFFDYVIMTSHLSPYFCSLEFCFTTAAVSEKGYSFVSSPCRALAF